LRFALRGGELAARTALEMLETGAQDGHVRLARHRRHEFGRKWRLNRTLRSVVASPAGVHCASAAAALAPVVFRRLIAIAGDAPADLKRAG
jgi:hypothetical protein